MIPKVSHYGRRGMPRDYVARLAADYQRLGSLEKVALLHGRTRQSVWDTLARRGLTRKRVALQAIWHRGEKFTPDPQGYYRSTCRRGKRRMLHFLIWEQTHGPVPDGHELRFIDGNRANCVLENLRCMTALESRRERRHENPFTIYRKRKAALCAEALAALDAVDAGAMAKAIDALEALRAPEIGITQREKAKTNFRDFWAGMTPEERAAHVAKALAARKCERAIQGEGAA